MSITLVELDGTARSLQKLFRVYNRAYFNGELDPEIQVRFTKKPFKGDMAMYDGEGTIWISRQFRKFRRLCCLFLLHEMSHIWKRTANCSTRNRAHNASMLRLAHLGALKGIW